MFSRLATFFGFKPVNRIDRMRQSLVFLPPPPRQEKPKAVFSPAAHHSNYKPATVTSPGVTVEENPPSNCLAALTFFANLPENLVEIEGALRSSAGKGFIVIIFCDAYAAQKIRFEDLVQRFRSGKIVFQDGAFVFYLFIPEKRDFIRTNDYDTLPDLLKAEKESKIVLPRT